MSIILTKYRGIGSFITVLAPILLFLATATWVFAADESGSDSELGQFYEEALQYYAKGEYRSAVIQLKNALQKNTSHLPSRILLGKCYLAAGYPALAEVELLNARELGADNRLIALPLAESYLRLRKFDLLLKDIQSDSHSTQDAGRIMTLKGQAYIGLKWPERALQAFKSAAALDPGSVDALLGQAEVHVGRGAFDKAGDLLQAAIGLDAENPQIWLLRSRISQASERFDEALSSLGRALELRPGHHQSLLARAKLLVDLGRYDAAQQDLDLLQVGKPVEPVVDYLQALVSFQKGDAEAARRHLKLAAETLENLPPTLLEGNTRLLLLAGSVEFAIGNSEKALVILKKVVARSPENRAARQLLVRIYLTQGQPENAYKMLEPLLLSRRNDPSIQMQLGQIHAARGNHLAAAKIFEQLSEQAPEDGAARLNLARSQVELRRIDSAIETLGTIDKQGGEAISAGLMTAILNLRKGENQAAAEAAQNIITVDRENLTAHNLLGVARLQLGDTHGARASFIRALEINPDFLPARLNLGRVDAAEGKPGLARSAYQALLDEKPDDKEVLDAFAKLEQSLGNIDEAIRWREKLRSFYPETLDSNLSLVELYLNSGQPDKALKTAQGVQSNHPDLFAAKLALAVSQIDAGRGALARVTLANLSRWVSYDAGKLHRIARLQKRLNDEKAAYWTLTKAVEGAPDWVTAKVELALVALKLKKFEEALNLALQLQIEKPGLSEGYFLEGEVLLQERKAKAAERAYLRAQKLKPQAVIVERLYRIYRFTGRSTEASTLLSGWLQQHPDEQLVLNLKAGELIGLKQYREATEVYEKILTAKPDDPSLLNNLAMLYQMTGNSKALQTARQANKLAPKDSYIADTLGWILIQSGKPQEALGYLREAKSRNATLPDIGYHLALALHALGRDDEAKTELKTVTRPGVEFSDREAAKALLRKLSGNG